VSARERLQPGDAVRIRNARWIVQRQTAHGSSSTLDVRGGESSNAGETARFLLPFEPVERAVAVRTPRVVRPTRWRVLARAALASATPRIDSLRSARGARFDLMPYQLEPALAVTTGIGCRLLIADEVGLGKTVQAGLIIAEMLDRQPDGRALVVCPAGLRSQWQHELHSRFGLSAALLDATGVAITAAALDSGANPWSACRLIITSIDFIKRPEVLRAVEGLVWDTVVLDEAHHLATRSDRATAAAALAVRARTTVLLSATPHSGDAAAFARLCALGDSGGRFPLLFFRRTREDAGLAVRRRTRWLHVRPTAMESEMLTTLVDYARRVWNARPAADAARLAMAVLLRRASSSAASLARSVERRLVSIGDAPSPAIAQLALPFVDPSTGDEEPVLAIAAPGLADVEEERRQLEHLLSLARVAAARESKLVALARWVSRVREPVLVFTEYQDTLAHLRQTVFGPSLPAEAVVELHGGLTRTERQAAEEKFVSGDARVLLATDAASEGVNLHRRCRCVINLEIPWSPVRLEQRIGRVDRIGQDRWVHAINLVAAGTHEVTTVERLLAREQRATAVLRAAATSDMAMAGAILTGLDAPADHAPVTVPGFTRRPELSALASVEASWIATARRLGTGGSDASRRPFVATLKPSTRRLLWIAEAAAFATDDVPIWKVLVGVEVATPRRGRRTSSEVLSALEAVDGQLESLGVGLTRSAIAAGNTLNRFVTVSADREHAICSAIRARHARIAAELLQPGLFDRRAERRATDQSQVLEAALAQCQRRLDELARLADLRAGPPMLRFAVFC
jgi:superfamily II DNA or RNA helicase